MSEFKEDQVKALFHAHLGSICMESRDSIVAEMEKKGLDGEHTITVEDFHRSNNPSEVLTYHMALQYALTRPDPEKWVAEI